MTPQNFAERMRSLVGATNGEPRIRDELAIGLMVEALATNGFHEGAALLVNASPEKLDPSTAALAVERSRHG